MKIDELITDEVKTVGITGHISPDGDCVGSCMGLYLYLKRNYPSVRADVFLESVPQELKIIKDTDVVRTEFQTDVDVYDLFFSLDSEKSRTGKAEKLFDAAKKKVNIDHHVSNAGTGDVNYIKPEASSVCELMVEVMDVKKMDVEIAKSLYIGIATDTGMFHYSCTSPKTMRTAATLMEFPFAHDQVLEHVELERTYKQNYATGLMLSESRLCLDDKCIVVAIDLERMQKEGLSREDLDPVVSQMNLTVGVECAIFAYQTPDKRYKVSLRSKGKVNVAQIAEAFQGGGHERASGCTIDGGMSAIEARLLPMVAAQLGLTV